ncbi:MAG: methyltransferase domain-containing protein [Sediminibacterium magnilacihabitans]|jgi:ubiquinone/menaquinone biosynthesis C-methylase UbiE|nr:methyltransferase domain-containing protein [Sediminibacterium magnilacihabitans]PQV61885.1 ubiquinone/menaquinone biosynthesis C-methylase UbiE [Sediminibacterium magnilacihabitans]
MEQQKKFIPALRFKWLTPVYDFFISITMPEKKIKKALISDTNIYAGAKLLDFGCGTATLTIMAKQSSPEAKVTGIDVDKEILEKATKKIKEERLDIFLFDYDGKHLPFQRNAFDRVISCLVFHHLDTDVKQNMLAEIFRVMNKDGELVIADFGRSKSWIQRMLFNMIRSLDGFKSTDANARGLLPEMISDAGFENVGIKNRFKTMFGEVQIISAKKI